MLDGEYTYQPKLELIRPGFPGEESGVLPSNPPAVTTSDATGTASYTYYYSDSNSANMANSSRVEISITDSWRCEIIEDNYLRVRVKTTVNSIKRTDIRGNPLIGGTYTRDIAIAQSKADMDAQNFFFYRTFDPINTAHDLSGPIELPEQTFTLAPKGGSGSRSSVYILNHTTGLPWDNPDYTDEMAAGISFTNNMINDYRPGATFNGVSWGSNNNAQGACHVYTGSSWQECRTDDWPTGTGNPPFGYNSSFKNQAKIPNQN